MKNEAKKRYKAGDYIECLSDKKIRVIEDCGIVALNIEYNFAYFGGVKIFDNGIWAEIIPSKKMTHKEIEKELGYKIEIV